MRAGAPIADKVYVVMGQHGALPLGPTASCAMGSQQTECVCEDYVDVTREALQPDDQQPGLKATLPPGTCPANSSCKHHQQQPPTCRISPNNSSSSSSAISSPTNMRQQQQQQQSAADDGSIQAANGSSSSSSRSDPDAECCSAVTDVISDGESACYDDEPWDNGSEAGSSSDTFSEIGDPATTEVIYVREGVSVWPSKTCRILGRLSLVKQHAVLFLAWLPYSAAAAATAAAAAAAAESSQPDRLGPAAAAAATVTSNSSNCCSGQPEEGLVPAAVGKHSSSSSSVAAAPKAGRADAAAAAAAVVAAASYQIKLHEIEEQVWVYDDEAAAEAEAAVRNLDGSSSSDWPYQQQQQRQQVSAGLHIPVPLAAPRQRQQQQQQQQQQLCLGGPGSPATAAAAAATNPLPSSAASNRSKSCKPPPPPAAAAASSSSSSSDVGRSMYAIHPIPLSDIKAFVRHTPPIGQQHVVVVLNSGLTLPPLVFQLGGVKDFVAVLSQHTSLVKAADDGNTLLVNDTADPLQRCLVALDVADIILGAPPPGVSCVDAPERFAVQNPPGLLNPGLLNPGLLNPGLLNPGRLNPGLLNPRSRGEVDGLVGQGQGAWQDLLDPAAAAATGPAAAAVPAGFVEVRVSAENGDGVQEGLGNRLGLSHLRFSHGSSSSSSSSAVRPSAAAAAAAADRHSQGVNHSSRSGAAATISSSSSGSPTATTSHPLRQQRNQSWGTLGNVLGSQLGGVLGNNVTMSVTNSVTNTLSKVGQLAVGGASSLVAAAVESWQSETLRYFEQEVNIPEEWRAEIEDLGNGYVVQQQQQQGQQQQQWGSCTAAAAADATQNCPEAAVAAAVAAAVDSSALAPGGTTPFHLQQQQQQKAPIIPPPPAAAAAAVGGDIDTDLGVFELLEGGIGPADQLAAVRARAASPPLTLEELESFLDERGVMVDEAGFRERVFQGGIEPVARRESWKFLLGVYPPGSSSSDRQQQRQQRQQQYDGLSAQWRGVGPDQARRFAKWRERRTRIDKDVRRTDRQHPFYRGREAAVHLTSLRDVLRAYSLFNFDLGYCQGMSDLASPLLLVMEGDEVDAFWCFVGLMERLSTNFAKDQAGMHTQLAALRRLVQVLDPQLHAFLEERDCLNYFFAFRWLLVHFKREFAFDQVLTLWEAFWSCPLTPHLHLYLAAAVLIHHRRVLLSDQQLCFDGMLRFCVELSGKIDLHGTLRLAEALVVIAGPAGQHCLEDLP